MSTAPALTPWQQFLAVPDDQAAELIDGEVFAHAKPSAPHQEVAGAIDNWTKGMFQYTTRGGPGGWIILREVELQILQYRRHFAPDVCGWTRDRLPKVPRTPRIDLRPDWVCEVVSPRDATRQKALKLKIPIYAESGVGHMWLVHPTDETLQAYKLSQGVWTLIGTYAPEDAARIPPFEALEFRLSEVWADIETDDL